MTGFRTTHILKPRSIINTVTNLITKTRELKILLTVCLLTFTSWKLISCKTKQPVKTVFISSQKDTATGLNETKIYILKKKTINSDIDYSKLDDIDGNIKDTLNLRSLMPIFEPISGHYNYYQFIATFKGHSFQEVDEDFHDILIIKTDNKNKIVDAFQYTLEWAEMPCQHDLFKSCSTGLTLADDLLINSLKLVRTDYWDEKDKFHQEGGILKLQ
jgi:hypothetical protein